MVPYVTSQFLGCDITMNEDVIVRKAMGMQNVNTEIDEGTEGYDSVPLAQFPPISEALIEINNSFASLAAMDDEPLKNITMGESPSKSKRKKKKLQKSQKKQKEKGDLTITLQQQ